MHIKHVSIYCLIVDSYCKRIFPMMLRRLEVLDYRQADKQTNSEIYVTILKLRCWQFKLGIG